MRAPTRFNFDIAISYFLFISFGIFVTYTQKTTQRNDRLSLCTRTSNFRTLVPSTTLQFFTTTLQLCSSFAGVCSLSEQSWQCISALQLSAFQHQQVCVATADAYWCRFTSLHFSPYISDDLVHAPTNCTPRKSFTRHFFSSFLFFLSPLPSLQISRVHTQRKAAPQSYLRRVPQSFLASAGFKYFNLASSPFFLCLQDRHIHIFSDALTVRVFANLISQIRHLRYPQHHYGHDASCFTG